MRLLFTALAAMLVASPVQAQPLADTDFRSLLPDMIAAALLPPSPPPIVRADFVELPGAIAIDYVHLFERPHAVAEDFCGQRILSLRMTPIPVDRSVAAEATPHRIGDVQEVATYHYNATGRACDHSETYFHIYSADRDTAFADVRRLAALIGQVRANPDAPLPFPAECRDEFDYLRRCSPSAMITALSTDNIQLVATRRGDELRLGLPLEDRARRGEGRLVEISLRQNVMHYTVRMLVRGDGIIALYIGGGIPIP